MKMKLFSASSLDAALAQMKAELGPDAVVLSTHEENGVFEVRAAVERTGPRPVKLASSASPHPASRSDPSNPAAPPGGPQLRGQRKQAPDEGSRALLHTQSRDRIGEILKWGGAPDPFADLLSEGGARLAGGQEPVAVLTAGLEGLASFAPIQPRPARSLMLIGAPGAGRSTAAAKLALRLSDLDAPLEPVAADFDASGGAARLAALVRKPTILATFTPEALVRLLDDRSSQARRYVIDAPAVNPQDEQDMARLLTLIERLDVEPVLVISAEGHPMDLEDTARAFARIGARRAIITKLDVVKRRAGVISAISSARLSIAQLGLTMSVGGGLVPATASRIAKLLLDPAPEAELLRGAA
ncbi:GTP-binding protein [bacterium]|nr:GTP-binding protein [bacterium]